MNLFRKSTSVRIGRNYQKGKIKSSIKIIVAGTDRGVGATHFSVLMANYYRSIMKKKVAIVDLNKDDDYIRLKYAMGKELDSDSFVINSVTYYPKATKKTLEEIFSKEFECIIIDVGNSYNKYKLEAGMCDKRFMITSMSPWKQNFVDLNSEEYQAYYNINEWKQVFVFGGINNYAEIMEKIPFIESPYKIDRKILDVVRRIIGEE